MRNICLIPARSGSKGLVDKNMAFLNGKPLLQYTIEAAIKSEVFNLEDIYVSTDSKDYIKHLDNFDINMIHRNQNLATDNTTTEEVVVEFLKGFNEDINLVLLQPTSPLRTGNQISEAFELYFKNGQMNPVVSVSKVDKSPDLFTKLGVNGELIDIVGIDNGYRRQNEEDMYTPNGAIYIIDKNKYLKEKSFFLPETIGYKMSKKSSADIDDYEDYIKVVGAMFFDYNRRERENKKFYKEIFSEKKEKSTKIILGDSRTEGLRIKNYSNYSMGGVTLATMLDIVDDNLDCENKSDVIINLGINDIIVGYKIDEIKNNMLNLIKKFKACNITVCTIFPTIYRPNINNQLIIELNNFIKNIDNINIVDIYDTFEENTKLKYKFTYDGLHLNDEGNKKLQKLIETEIGLYE